MRSPRDFLRAIGPLLALLLVAGCTGRSDDPSAADARALAREQGASAIAITLAAVDGRVRSSQGKWASCMAYPVWRYQGVAILSVPEGDHEAQLARIDSALRQAGYTSSLTKAAGKVVAGKPNFSFIVEQARLKPDQPRRWKAQFQSEPCSRFSGRDRKGIRAQNGRPEALNLDD